MRERALPARFLPAVMLIISAPVLACCAVSQEIVVEFPQDADWHFEYYDTLGERIGFGKALVAFGEKRETFKMTVTENAFGDQAALTGTVLWEEATGQALPFRADGVWFSGEEFRFEGAFNRTLTGVSGCAVGYVRGTQWRQRGLDYDPRACRVTWPDRGGDGPAGEYLDRLFMWTAQKRDEGRP